MSAVRQRPDANDHKDRKSRLAAPSDQMHFRALDASEPPIQLAFGEELA